jgi:hypothetical protein
MTVPCWHSLPHWRWRMHVLRNVGNFLPKNLPLHLILFIVTSVTTSNPISCSLFVTIFFVPDFHLLHLFALLLWPWPPQFPIDVSCQTCTTISDTFFLMLSTKIRSRYFQLTVASWMLTVGIVTGILSLWLLSGVQPSAVEKYGATPIIRTD